MNHAYFFNTDQMTKKFDISDSLNLINDSYCYFISRVMINAIESWALNDATSRYCTVFLRMIVLVSKIQ